MIFPRLAFTSAVAVQVLLVSHPYITSFPVIVGATTTSSTNNKEGEDTTVTSILKPGRGGLKKSSQEVASTAFGASDGDQHHILRKKEAPAVVPSNAADQTTMQDQEEAVLGDGNDYPHPDNINMIHDYDKDKDIQDYDPEENFASELQDMTFPTKKLRKTRRLGIPVKPEDLETVSIYDGLWGDWGEWVGYRNNRSFFENYAYDHYYACGAELRVEEKQGRGDDTAANGLRITFCGDNFGYGRYWEHFQSTETPAKGNWGTWRGKKMCPSGTHIAGARVRFEDRQGSGDDTGLNGLEIFCIDPSLWMGEEIIGEGTRILVENGYWGEWKEWEYFERGKLARYVRCREEGRLGARDDTALNGIQFKVETPF